MIVPTPPRHYGPVDTSDPMALTAEIDRLGRDIDQWSSMKLYGDDHCDRNDYLKWAKRTREMLTAFRDNLNNEEPHETKQS